MTKLQVAIDLLTTEAALELAHKVALRRYYRIRYTAY
jgi:3-keto-L-gulonate-6-phosphate decarboxylase